MIPLNNIFKKRIKTKTKMTNGTKLRMIRQIKGYKQDYVAEQLGMSQTNYSNIEIGKQK